MTRCRKILIGIIASVFIAVAVFVGCQIYALVYTVHRVPEAYAAWDTGRLLVEYMKTHDNRWPTSWDELLTVVHPSATNEFIMRGSHGPGDTNYLLALRNFVAVDWTFDPKRPDQRSIVTRSNGTKLMILWEDPNETVRMYLSDSVAK